MSFIEKFGTIDKVKIAKNLGVKTHLEQIAIKSGIDRLDKIRRDLMYAYDAFPSRDMWDAYGFVSQAVEALTDRLEVLENES